MSGQVQPARPRPPEVNETIEKLIDRGYLQRVEMHGERVLALTKEGERAAREAGGWLR